MNDAGRPEGQPAEPANGRVAIGEDDLVRIAEPLSAELKRLAAIAPDPWARELRRIARSADGSS